MRASFRPETIAEGTRSKVSIMRMMPVTMVGSSLNMHENGNKRHVMRILKDASSLYALNVNAMLKQRLKVQPGLHLILHEIKEIPRHMKKDRRRIR